MFTVFKCLHQSQLLDWSLKGPVAVLTVTYLTNKIVSSSMDMRDSAMCPVHPSKIVVTWSLNTLGAFLQTLLLLLLAMVPFLYSSKCRVSASQTSMQGSLDLLFSMHKLIIASQVGKCLSDTCFSRLFVIFCSASYLQRFVKFLHDFVESYG
jgi:hypothetical protein